MGNFYKGLNMKRRLRITENEKKNILKLYGLINEGFIKLSSEDMKQIDAVVPMLVDALSGEYLGDGKYKHITGIISNSADGTNTITNIYIGNNLDELNTYAIYATNDKRNPFDNIIVFQQFNFIKFFSGRQYWDEFKSEGGENIGIELVRKNLIHELIHAKDPNSNHRFDDEEYSKTIASVYYKSWKEFKAITGQFLNTISSNIDRNYNIDVDKILDALDNILEVYAGKAKNFNQNAIELLQGSSIKSSYFVANSYIANIIMVRTHNPEGYKRYLRELYKTIEALKITINKKLKPTTLA